MTGFNHALTGIGIAIAVTNPVIIAPLALASHFILDMLPHFYLKSFGGTLTRPYRRSLRWFLAFDAVVTLIVIAAAFYLWPQAWLALATGIFFAMAPDILWPLNGKVKWLKKFFQFHQKIQWFEKPWGAFFEVPFTLILVTVIYL